MIHAVTNDVLELTLYDQTGTGRKWQFTEPPSVQANHNVWRLKSKHPSQEFMNPTLAREMICLVVQVEADMECSTGFNIKLTSPLSGNLIKTFHQESTRMSVRHFQQFLCEELRVNDVKMMVNGSYVDVMASARMTIKRLFGFMADQQALYFCVVSLLLISNVVT